MIEDNLVWRERLRNASKRPDWAGGFSQRTQLIGWGREDCPVRQDHAVAVDPSSTPVEMPESSVCLWSSCSLAARGGKSSQTRML